MNGEVRVVNDVAAEFASLVAENLTSNLVLSGGSTATACYRQLAQLDFDWSNIEIFWGDERKVAADHEDSNYLLARNAMSSVLDAAGAVHPMTDAGAYDTLIADAIPLDVVHLGVGDDGHVASIFPDSETLRTTGNLAVDAGDELHEHPRVTLTYDAIDSAKLVIYTVVGANKAAMIERVRNGADLPVNRVRARRQVWLIDPAANG